MRVPPESDFGKDLDDLVEWLNTEGAEYESGRDETLVLVKEKGSQIAKPGDWIIKGLAGDFYVCIDEVFAKTYEEVSYFERVLHEGVVSKLDG